MISEKCFKISQCRESMGNGAVQTNLGARGEAIKGWFGSLGVGTWGWGTLHKSLYHYVCLKCSVINRRQRKKEVHPLEVKYLLVKVNGCRQP